MGKIYQVPQQANFDCRELATVLPPERPFSQVIVYSALPPLTMEREMERLYQSISALHSDSKKTIFQFVSSRKGEGCSTILREFGRYLSTKVHKSILLIDDAFKMDQQHAIRVPPGISLQQIMAKGNSVDQAFVQGKKSPVFLCRLLEDTALSVAHNIYEDIGEILSQLRKQFDYILIDSPPLSVSEDALALCSSVDGVILVVEAGKTRSQVVSYTKDRIIQNGGNILGGIFNKQRHYIPNWIYERL